jgi:hypothetical protein
MLCAIYLNNQPCGGSEEVDDVPGNNDLPPKPHAALR